MKQMQPMWLCIIKGRPFEDTHENAQWRKVKQMQPVWLCIFSGRQFEDTHAIPKSRKIPVFYFQKSQYRYLSPIPGYRYFPVYRRGLLAWPYLWTTMTSIAPLARASITPPSLTEDWAEREKFRNCFLLPFNVFSWCVSVWDVGHTKGSYRVFFGPALKVLSVEDGKIPTRKVKVQVKTSHFSVTHLCFHFFGGIFFFKT